MSGYRPGHEEGHDPYINYAAQAEAHPEERVFTHPQDIQHGGAQNINPLHGGHLGQHHQIHHQNPPQHHYPPHQIYTDQQSMAQQHQPPQYGGRQDMMHPGSSMQQATGTKRPRPEELGGMSMGGLPEQQMQPGGMGMGHQMGQSPMVGYGPPQSFHSHPLPPTEGSMGKRARIGEAESSQMSMGAPSVVGMEGMPMPAARPRGPKLKFTPEDDQLLVDLKENKSLTWKQIAEFFPGRSSGTLQVRYCTKLKAKTTQWTDETVSFNLCFCPTYPNSMLGTKTPNCSP